MEAPAPGVLARGLTAGGNRHRTCGTVKLGAQGRVGQAQNPGITDRLTQRQLISVPGQMRLPSISAPSLTL